MNEAAAPPAEDYPRTLLEFESRFSSEEACRAYLEELRWPDGIRCASCGSARGWRRERGFWVCASCAHETSVTSGTILERTRKPLRLWFRAMWLVTSQKSGVSALGLQRQLGLKRYETVWIWLHKLRRAMVRPGRDRLSGTVEVDETFVGGAEPGVAGRQTERKALVAIAAEEDGRGMGRIRVRRIEDASADQLLPFVADAVEPGSLVRTDGWVSYSGLKALGFKHKIINLARRARPAHELLPLVHRVASLLKRWWLGTHHGAIHWEHLDYYLDEFTFRFNRRKSRSRGKLFFRLIQQVLNVDPVTWQDVAAGRRASGHNR
jgi:transposase-like protein/ribosomal protein L37AE/L43A